MKALPYIHLVADIIKARLLHEVKPLVVCLNVTNRCNLKCAYCYGDYPNRTARDFTKGQLFSLIEKLSRMGTRLIHVSGGEPLIRDDIADIIQKIKSKNMLCFMNTNGILIPDKIHEIKKLDAITISLDGDETSNDATRGQGTFKRIIKAIEIAIAHGIPVSTNTVLNSNNVSSIDTIIARARKMDFTAEFNLPYEQSLGNVDNEAVKLTDDTIRTFLNKLIAETKNGSPLSFSVTTRKYALSWPFSFSEKIMYGMPEHGFKLIHCYMGQLMCLIDSDGLVYPCGQLMGKFPALNIHASGFEAAWENTRTKRTCMSCYGMCFTEFNQLFNLKPNILFSTAARFFKRK